MKNIILLFLLVSAVVLLLIGCDANVTVDRNDWEYYLSGALVKNMDSDNLEIAAVFKRDDTILTAAILNIENDTLEYGNGIYTKSYETALSLDTGDYYLDLVDADDFVDSVLFTIPDRVIITSIIPGSRIYRSGDIASIEWSTSYGTDGYAYGVTKKDEAYKTDGYSAFVTSGATAITIPKEAFSLPSSEIDTGWYYIYLYGYADAPAPGNSLPTSFPPGLSENISDLNFTGKFGSIVISRYDSLHVVIQ